MPIDMYRNLYVDLVCNDAMILCKVARSQWEDLKCDLYSLTFSVSNISGRSAFDLQELTPLRRTFWFGDGALDARSICNCIHTYRNMI